MKCFKCGKKIKMIDEIISKCKCGNKYCLTCLPSFNHDCKFDYGKEKKMQLGKDNCQIIPDKVIKI